MMYEYEGILCCYSFILRHESLWEVALWSLMAAGTDSKFILWSGLESLLGQ